MTQFFSILALITLTFNFATAQKFSNTLERDNDAPIAKWSHIATNLGIVPNGATVTESFAFTNNGGDGLQVLSATTTTPGVHVIPTKASLNNGESGSITVISTTQYNGTFSAQIKVTTNADNAQQTLYIMGQVQKVNSSK